MLWNKKKRKTQYRGFYFYFPPDVASFGLVVFPADHIFCLFWTDHQNPLRSQAHMAFHMTQHDARESSFRWQRLIRRLWHSWRKCVWQRGTNDDTKASVSLFFVRLCYGISFSGTWDTDSRWGNNRPQPVESLLKRRNHFEVFFSVFI